ncbi:Sporulation related domain protein [Roseovarius gaetbuli]|uniref:Sporulation related domain protein n=1 Tax=Roseovarius gaetbuli TaxID=1356575 RepID=A0A1X6ZWS0_9RHOB|nr:SPOR domain-containing protein [Roseovarius gaetbuli]SLN63941.1 Sporulation related domain protein [Roseovarius gaetbuli]
MNLSRLPIIAIAAALFGAMQGNAQSLRDAPTPAEFPASSYQGRQYVDSRGCVFIRAGVGANVTWVPRITRDRKALCGFQPSVAKAAPAAAPAAKPAPAEVAAIAPAPAKPTRAVSAPAAKATPPKPAGRAAAAPPKTVRRTVKTAPAVAVAPVRKAPASPTPVRKAAAPKVTQRGTIIAPPDPSRTACAGMSSLSAAYMVQHKGSPVRCGPQATRHVTYGKRVTSPAAQPRLVTRESAARSTGHAGRATRVAPARVYARQKNSAEGVYVPEGYKPVWEDDRLNLKRAHQTYAGMDQMEVMWTNTVPRRLINRRSGREVSHNFPGLTPPYTSFAQQRAAGVTVSTQGRFVPDPITVRRSTRVKPVAAKAPRATVSTRSASAKSAGAASHRYAQAGIFADPTQGKAAAQKIARAGLSARRGTLNRDGRALTVVLAGPFKTQAQLDASVSKLRGMGFGNVVLRK